MGTLQSFTPLPQAKQILFLYNPSKELNSIISSPVFQQIYKFTIKIVDKFPLSSFLEAKNSSERNKMKVLVQQQNLIDINHLVLIFHHKIIIVTKAQKVNLKNQNLKQKSLKFKDDLNEESQRSYSPILIKCLRHCMSVSIKQLKQYLDQKTKANDIKIQQNEDKPNTNQLQIPLDKQISFSINAQNAKQLASNIRLHNYKRRSTHLSRSERKNSKKILSKSFHLTQNQIQMPSNIFNQNISIPDILGKHHYCTFVPISLLLAHLSIRMINKILNLLHFYELDVVKYPSLDLFFAAQCNSSKIICCSNQLQELSRKVQAEQYPFNFTSPSTFSFLSSAASIFPSDSMNVIHQSQNILQQQQDITFYCFCPEPFSNNFENTNSKLIGVLKDKLIQIKFFKNMLELVKQVIKDQNVEVENQILHQILTQKTNFISFSKLKSSKDANGLEKCQEDQICQQNKSSNQVFNANKNVLTSNQEVQNQSGKTISKIESYSSLQKRPRFNNIISQRGFSNPGNRTLKKTPRISIVNGATLSYPTLSKNSTSIIPKSSDQRYSSVYPSTIYFLMHEKQKDRYSIQSLPKKLTRHLKNIKVKKILSLQSLVEKIKHASVSIVIINENIKILQQFYMAMEMNSIQDKLIVIKRQQSQTYESLFKKINQVRQLGIVKMKKYYQFRNTNKKLIIIGSKIFLKHILTVYPYLEIKEFIDITIYKEHRRVRQVISRKNQIIVSNVAICQNCNQEYKGLVKAKIIFYQSNVESNRLILMGGTEDCHCTSKSILGQKKQPISLKKLIDESQTYFTSYPYSNKKLTYWSNQISTLILKIKEKKILFNAQNQYQPPSQLLFLCADSWIIQQITMIIIKMFNTRYSSIWLAEWMVKKIAFKCIKQIQFAIQFHVQARLKIFKGQIPSKINQTIQDSKIIYKRLQIALQEVESIFQLSQVLLQLFISNSLFRQCVNYLWRNLLALNKHQFPFSCSTLFLVLFLGFRKAGTMQRNDSINDGTFKSFRKLTNTDKNTMNKPCQNDKPEEQLQKGITNCSFQQRSSFLGSSQFKTNKNCVSPHSSSPSNQTTINNFIPIQQIIIEEQKNTNHPSISSPKIYLKLSNFEKQEGDQSLRKFFISKNNAFSYIYTTQFLIFEMIDEEEIQEMVLANLKQKQKLTSTGATNFNSTGLYQKNNYTNGNRNSDSMSSNGASYSNTNTNFGMTFPLQSKNQRNGVKNGYLIGSSIPLSPLISPLLNSSMSNKSNAVQSRIDLPLELKSCRNIELLSSTDDSLIIFVQNMELLNYNSFVPFYRSFEKSSQNSSKKKHFILPPFTKLEINNNYNPFNNQNSNKSSASLITHQLKLSIDHQQRFLQRILQTFLVDKSQYYDSMDQAEKQRKQKSIELDSSKLFNYDDSLEIKDPETNGKIRSINDEELFILKTSNKDYSQNTQNNLGCIKLLQQKFKLPYTDQFFILMNEFKYFSAHYLLISYLPKTNMTNAYHSILLSRKGLYAQALDILLPSNPFKTTIQIYINELKNRMLSSNQIIEDQYSQNFSQRPKTMKWNLSFAYKQQKFTLVSRNDPDKSYCFNEDSLDVVYKQVLANHQCDKNLRQSTNNGQTSSNFDGILTGTFVNSKKSTRRAKKQSSIAICSDHNESLNSNWSKQLSNFEKVQSSIHRRSGINMSTKSRDSILNQMSFLQYIHGKNDKINNEGPRIRTNRRSQVSYRSSSFMFGMPNRETKRINLLNNEDNQYFQHNQMHDAAQNLKMEALKININELIQQNSSSESQSEQKEIFEGRCQHQKKKSTIINVKTRNKSSFFLNYAQQIKRQADKAEKIKNGSEKQKKQEKNENKMKEDLESIKSLQFNEISGSSEEDNNDQIKRKMKQKVQGIMRNDHLQQKDDIFSIAKSTPQRQNQKYPLLFKTFQEQDSSEDGQLQKQYQKQKQFKQNQNKTKKQELENDANLKQIVKAEKAEKACKASKVENTEKKCNKTRLNKQEQIDLNQQEHIKNVVQAQIETVNMIGPCDKQCLLQKQIKNQNIEESQSDNLESQSCRLLVEQILSYKQKKIQAQPIQNIDRQEKDQSSEQTSKNILIHTVKSVIFQQQQKPNNLLILENIDQQLFTNKKLNSQKLENLNQQKSISFSNRNPVSQKQRTHARLCNSISFKPITQSNQKHESIKKLFNSKLKSRFTLDFSQSSEEQEKQDNQIIKRSTNKGFPQQIQQYEFQNINSSQAEEIIELSEENSLNADQFKKSNTFSQKQQKQKSPYKQFSCYLQQNQQQQSQQNHFNNFNNKQQENHSECQIDSFNKDKQGNSNIYQGFQRQEINDKQRKIKKLHFFKNKQKKPENNSKHHLSQALSFSFKKKNIQSKLTEIHDVLSSQQHSSQEKSQKNTQNQNQIKNQNVTSFGKLKQHNISQSQVSDVESKQKKKSSQVRDSMQSSIINSSQDQLLRRTQDNQEFLNSHASIFLWQNHHEQTQKTLKSSKKMIINNQSSKKLNINSNKVILGSSRVLLSASRTVALAPSDKQQKRQSDRLYKNAFTFMRPSTGPQNKPIYNEQSEQQQQIDAESQHISDFHNKLMNNSSIFININDNLPFSKYVSGKQNFLNIAQQTHLNQTNNKKFIIEEKMRKQGLKPSYESLDEPEEKFSIIVKTMTIVEQPADRIKKNQKIIRKSAQDFSHEYYETSNKSNRTSEQPISRCNKVSKQRQSIDSWFDCSSNTPQYPTQLSHLTQNQDSRKNSARKQVNMIGKSRVKKPPLDPNRHSGNTEIQQDSQFQQLKCKKQYTLAVNACSKIHQSNQDKIQQKSDSYIQNNYFRRQASETLPFHQSDNKNQVSIRQRSLQESPKQYKIHPEQLLYLSPYYLGGNNEKSESSNSQNLSNQKFNQSLTSLRNLRLNCDIRRKR